MFFSSFAEDPPKLKNRDDASVVDDEEIGNDSQMDRSALDASRKSGKVAPVVPRPPDRKTPSPPESPDQSLHPTGSDVQAQTPPPRASAVVVPSASAGDIDDFFS